MEDEPSLPVFLFTKRLTMTNCFIGILRRDTAVQTGKTESRACRERLILNNKGLRMGPSLGLSKRTGKYDYRKRGSASYIVREVHSVRERERD